MIFHVLSIANTIAIHPQAPPDHVLLLFGYLSSTQIHSTHEHIKIHQQIYATHKNNPLIL